MPLDANNTSAPSDKNLDVAGTSQNQDNLERKEPTCDSAPARHISVVCPFPALHAQHQKPRGSYRPLGSKHISIAQATNIINAVKFAKLIGSPLVAHLTIHWSGTVAFDDPDGKRFAKVREGLNKVLLRRGIRPLWVWCRECKAHTDIVHSHLLFHLPIDYRVGPKFDGITHGIERLVDRHGDGILGEFAVTLKLWRDPDGLYLIKGGSPAVWKRFPRIRTDWRKPQGVIHGKRCGTSQNLGAKARGRDNSEAGADGWEEDACA